MGGGTCGTKYCMLTRRQLEQNTQLLFCWRAVRNICGEMHQHVEISDECWDLWQLRTGKKRTREAETDNEVKVQKS